MSLHRYRIEWSVEVVIDVPDDADPRGLEAADMAALAAADHMRDRGPDDDDIDYIGPERP